MQRLRAGWVLARRTWFAIWLGIAISGCQHSESPDPETLRDLFVEGQTESEAVSDPWTNAVVAREFAFPRDHAAHEGFRIEWWYYTGNLTAADGRRFGYQLTFFRTGTNWQTDNPSRWAVRDLYTAHFAISDLQTSDHHAFQRNNRRGVGWAGAESDRYEVWNGDWKVWLDGENHRLVARQAGCAIDLVLSPSKPLVLQGDNGLSRKGASPGNASYYYSFTRLQTSGRLRVGNRDFSVEGLSWMDHEFSSSLLEQDQVGWDWFSIQLDNDRELMLYRMRRQDGTADRFSSGTCIDEDGTIRRLTSDDFKLTPLDTWTSAETGAKYPVDWQVDIPGLEMRLRVRAAFADQEMTTRATSGISYWEGSVEVDGRVSGKTTRGTGYLEMTGYSGRSLGDLFRARDD